ncbi:MAG: class I SAM-dependent methyltransferase [Verrucomicrobiae bacterium]|nr:class I SAM-dependent methyltransferase [Verrucomicrobiae bacterium]
MHPDVRRPCPICATTDSVPFLTKASLQLVRCRTCNLVHADPLPADADASAYDRLGHPYYLSPDKLGSDYAGVRFERELRLLRRHCPRGRVLDVGCNTGAFLFHLLRRFGGDYSAVGLDVSRSALDHARQRGLPVLDGSLLTHDFGAARFDAITFWAVIEHLPDPAPLLRRAAELLSPGGVCLAIVPNLDSLAFRLLGARYRYVLPQHVNYFTRSTLDRLFLRSGLVPLAHGGCHFNPVVLWQDRRLPPHTFVPDAERASLLRTTTRLKQSPRMQPARRLLAALERLLAFARLTDNIWVVAQAA